MVVWKALFHLSFETVSIARVFSFIRAPAVGGYLGVLGAHRVDSSLNYYFYIVPD